jgi:hypothetical protein
VRGDRLDQVLQYLAIALARDGGRCLGAVNHARMSMVHDGSSHCALTIPAARPGHALKDAILVRLERAESAPVLNFEPKEVNGGACVCFGVVSALTVRLDLALTPFLSEPTEPGFEWSAVGGGR